jgi:hypothetical protein
MSEKNVITTDGESEVLPAIADNTLIALAEQAEKRVDAMHKIKRMALKLTNPHDWVDENGKPYLQASGGEKVARLFGISWRISEPVKDNIEGGHFTYTYHGEFSLSGASIEAIGTRSSKDGFFKKYEWKGEEGNKTRVELPVSEIDPGDVKKSAYTNLLANGITRLLGIRNLTYEDLKEFAGITKEQITSVEYRKSGKSQPAPAARKAAPQTQPGEPEDLKALKFKNPGEFYQACLDHLKLTKTRVDAEITEYDLTKPDQLDRAWQQIVAIYGHKVEGGGQ